MMKKILSGIVLSLLLCLSFSMPAFAKDITACVSMEKFTLGQGYIIEPILVTVPENTRASRVITDLLGEDNYRMTGEIDSSFYLATVKNDSADTINVPVSILKELAASNRFLDERESGWLGEFDYSGYSGWMYSLNNVFPNVGAADRVLKEGDVMRWQFTLWGYGADVGESFMGPDNPFVRADKDALTYLVAEINGSSNAETLRASRAYKNALVVLEDLNASQEKVDDTAAVLEKYVSDGTDTTVVEVESEERVLLNPGDDISAYAPPDIIDVESVVLAQDTLEITEGESVLLTATVLPEDATNKTLVWGTDNLKLLSVEQDGTVTALAPGNATVVAKSNNGKIAVCRVTIKEKPPIPWELPFNDVSKDDYFYEPVRWALQEGITTGVSAGVFDPASTCTRGQMVTFLWRSQNMPEPKETTCNFTDVDPEAYYYKAMLWAVENGITQGVSNTEFAPDATVTRGQTVTFLYRAAGKPAVSGIVPFTDVKPGKYYYKAVKWAVANGITTGVSETEFAPDGGCTRGQIVTFLYRAR